MHRKIFSGNILAWLRPVTPSAVCNSWLMIRNKESYADPKKGKSK